MYKMHGTYIKIVLRAISRG